MMGLLCGFGWGDAVHQDNQRFEGMRQDYIDTQRAAYDN